MSIGQEETVIKYIYIFKTDICVSFYTESVLLLLVCVLYNIQKNKYLNVAITALVTKHSQRDYVALDLQLFAGGCMQVDCRVLPCASKISLVLLLGT